MQDKLMAEYEQWKRALSEECEARSAELRKSRDMNRLREAVWRAENCKQQLIGMMHLMVSMGKMSNGEIKTEIEALQELFDTERLYGAYILRTKCRVYLTEADAVETDIKKEV